MYYNFASLSANSKMSDTSRPNNLREINGKTKMTDTNLKDFEKALQQLEKIVNSMESGELGLEDSLKQFEQGIILAKNCQDTLSNAETRVEQLIEKNGLQQTIPFENPENP
jgi:exodeoxyribonuclease VII small subunit